MISRQHTIGASGSRAFRLRCRSGLPGQRKTRRLRLMVRPEGIKFDLKPWWAFRRKDQLVAFRHIKALKLEQTRRYSVPRILGSALLFGIGYAVLALVIMKMFSYLVRAKYIVVAGGFGLLMGILLGLRKARRGSLRLDLFVEGAIWQLDFEVDQAAVHFYACLNERLAEQLLGQQQQHPSSSQS